MHSPTTQHPTSHFVSLEAHPPELDALGSVLAGTRSRTARSSRSTAGSAVTSSGCSPAWAWPRRRKTARMRSASAHLKKKADPAGLDVRLSSAISASSRSRNPSRALHRVHPSRCSSALARPLRLDLPRRLGPIPLPTPPFLLLLDLKPTNPVPGLSQLPLRPRDQGTVLVQVGYPVRSCS